MLMSKLRWGLSLALLVFLFLGAGAVSASAKGTAKPSARFESDYRQFWSELRSNGAFKFMDETEDLLRSGQFDQAFSRYLFLKAHIRGQPFYAGLNATVDQRLHFLKSQLRLEEIPHYTISHQKLKTRASKPRCADQKEAKASTPSEVTPQEAKAEDQEPKAAKTSPAGKPAEVILSPSPTAAQAEPQAKEQGKPSGEEAQEEKPAEQKPAPALSYWDRIKRRLKFW